MGNKRFDVIRLGIRITRTSGTPDPVEFKVRERILDTLAQNSKIDTLRAFADGKLKMHDLIQARDQGLLLNDRVLDRITLRRNLWETLDRIFPKPTKKHGQAARYYASAGSFARKAGPLLGPKATVESLTALDWPALSAMWSEPYTVTIPGAEHDEIPKTRTYQAGPSDWMHCRRMISRALTVITKSEHSAFRLEVMAKIPTQAEVKRLPDLDVHRFETIAALTPEDIRAAYYVLFITGMRKGEYLRCDRGHTNATTHTIRVPGTKTDDAAGIIHIDPELWHWIEAGIPSPVAEGALGRHWRAARAQVSGCATITLHDLRHGAAMAATDEGAATAHIQALLRHSNPAMTLRYQARKSTQHAADAIGRAFTKQAKRAS